MYTVVMMMNLLVIGGIAAEPEVKEIARWSFERTDVGEAAGKKLPPRRAASAKATTKQRRGSSKKQPGTPNEVEAVKTHTYSDEVPGKFIYDPLTGTSRPNTASAVFHGEERESQALAYTLDFSKENSQESSKESPKNLSITMEAFVRAAPARGGDAWLVGKAKNVASKQGAGAAELALQWIHLPQHHQTWHGAQFVLPSGGGERFPAGHYSSSTRLSNDNPDWRHLAVVYDAPAKTVTCWVDYHLARTYPVSEPLRWDDGPVLIGGRPDHWGAYGHIDEARIVWGALRPAQFLRARADALTNVSFTSNQTLMPADAGCLDVKEHFGAAGDGQTDDTAAFNMAFRHLASKVPLAYNTLLVPAGEYKISGMLHCSRFIDVKGAGPKRTILRLVDGTFTDPKNPQPVLRMSSTTGAPGSHGWVNGSSISVYLEGLTINTGKNNPGAKALEYHSNNVGRLENVWLRSGDGAGVMGLDLLHHDVGPALVKNVRIEGFDVGTAIRYQEYSMTFEHLVLRGQRVVGIRNQGNILAIRKLQSENTVPAIISEGANSMVTLLDSRLTGGDPQQTAIQSDGGLYCLRVDVAGYGKAIAKRMLVNQKPMEWKTTSVDGPRLEEYIGDEQVTGHGSPKGALKLPIEETPEPPLPPIAEWVNAANFVAQKRGEDWGPAVQAAIDSGAKVVYFPRDTHFRFYTPIRLHGKIERLVGLGGELQWDNSVWQGNRRRNQTETEGAPPPLLIFDEPDAHRVVVLDRLGCVHLQHASTATLVLRSSSVDRYTTKVEGGKLFIEDVGGADWHFDHPQQVWVRQWNPESHEDGPCIHSRGTTLWVLGFKTEYESQKLLAEAGARTEILGSFIYPLGKIPKDRPIFENRDSQMSLVYGTSVYQSNHHLHVRDTRKDNVLEIGNKALRWAGSRARMDLYSSDAR